jgi:hypothetical protein
MDHPPPLPSPRATDTLVQTREKKGERKRDKVNKGLINRKKQFTVPLLFLVKIALLYIQYNL